jgi:hypothetical protein
LPNAGLHCRSAALTNDELALNQMETVMDSETSRSTSVWEPIPRSKCRQLASAGAFASDILKTVIFFGGIVLSILLCASVFGRPAPLHKDPIWWVCLVVLIAGPFLFLEWLLNRLHSRKRLSIDQEHVCFGSSRVKLAELKSISSGQFKVAMERYASTLEKAAVLANRPGRAAATIRGAAEARQQLRDHSLTLTEQRGKQVHWIGILAFFEKSDLESFFATLLERKPELEVEPRTTED